jgi:hypothetical protein
MYVEAKQFFFLAKKPVGYFYVTLNYRMGFSILRINYDPFWNQNILISNTWGGLHPVTCLPTRQIGQQGKTPARQPPYCCAVCSAPSFLTKWPPTIQSSVNSSKNFTSVCQVSIGLQFYQLCSIRLVGTFRPVPLIFIWSFEFSLNYFQYFMVNYIFLCLLFDHNLTIFVGI